MSWANEYKYLSLYIFVDMKVGFNISVQASNIFFLPRIKTNFCKYWLSYELKNPASWRHCSEICSKKSSPLHKLSISVRDLMRRIVIWHCQVRSDMPVLIWLGDRVIKNSNPDWLSDWPVAEALDQRDFYTLVAARE